MRKWAKWHFLTLSAELNVPTQTQTVYTGVLIDKNDVCLLPDELDEKVPEVHFLTLNFPLLRLISRRRP